MGSSTDLVIGRADALQDSLNITFANPDHIVYVTAGKNALVDSVLAEATLQNTNLR